MFIRFFGAVVLLVAITGSLGCGTSPTAPGVPAGSSVPSPPSAPTPAPPPTPVGHVTLAGTVTEVRGTAIGGAEVRTVDGTVTTVTDPAGAFRLADFSIQPLIVSRAGFEAVDVPRYLSNHDDVLVRLQREIRVVVDETATAVLFHDDPIYGASGAPHAGPGCLCKRLRVEAPRSGSVEIALTSQGPLSLWNGDTWPGFPANQPIRLSVSAGELVLYVGVDWFDGPAFADGTSFDVTTRFLP